MNKDIEKLFKQAKGYVEVDEQGNRSTYTYDFDPDVFASLIIEQCVQTLVNHGYTDAATVLSTEYADDWQQLEFPEI
jgi:predicted adenine nucleotide alpha hydrolase (AANH) superfamily ATPase